MTALKRPTIRTLGAVAGAAAALAALPIAFVWAQGGSESSIATAVDTTMAAALSGKAFPLTLQMKDFGGSDWRRVTLRDSSLPRGIEITPQVQLYRYYTQGRTIRVGGETFLAAYCRKLPEMRDMDKAAQLFLQGSDKPLPETVFTLTLLNLRTIGGLDDVQAVNLAEEMTTQAAVEGARNEARNAQSLSNLKQLGTALMMYTQDYDEKFPPMKTPQAVKKAVLPYLRNESAFTNPITGKPYLPNVWLSGKSLASFASPALIVGFYEDAPAPDGTRAAAFADGHAKRFPEKNWSAIAHTSVIMVR